MSFFFLLLFVFLHLIKGPASALGKGASVLASLGEVLQGARERRALLQQDQLGRVGSRAPGSGWLGVVDVASVDTQGRLGLGHGLTLQRLHCRTGSREGCRDLTGFIAEGPLVSENLCGVLAGEHCWREGTQEELGSSLHLLFELWGKSEGQHSLIPCYHFSFKLFALKQ